VRVIRHRRDYPMPDVIFVGLILLFFAAVVLLIKGLEGL
jgi:hypothetical protein